MRTYAELVKEAIRAAYEKSENEYKKFEVGRTYATRSVCNSECIFKITIIKRTEKTVTIDEGNGKTKRCKIYTDMRNAEAIYPYGIYSRGAPARYSRCALMLARPQDAKTGSA